MSTIDQVTPNVSPTQPSQRYKLIDALRGFALLGVVVGNWYWWGTHVFITHDQLMGLPTVFLDKIALFLTHVFVMDKFYTLFSILFGLGFALQLNKAKYKNVNIFKPYSRRLAILLIMGVLHAILFYSGDILHRYALLGFVLIIFHNRSDRFILYTILGIMLFLALFPTLKLILPSFQFEFQDMSRPERYHAVMHDGWPGIMEFNLDRLQDEYLDIWGQLSVYLEIFWRFLLGLYIGRKALLQNAGQHVGLFRNVFSWAIIIGLFGNCLLSVLVDGFRIYIPEARFPWSLLMIFVEVGIPALAISYLCAFALLYQKERWRRLLDLFAPIGRMALTNYLMQSVFFVFIFYGVGLSILGHVGMFIINLMAITVFALQMVISIWWLKRFKYGPAEWIWRCLTYLKWLPIRKPLPTTQ